MLIALVVPALPLAWLWDHNKRGGIVSADAKYIVRNLVVWFLVMPAAVAAMFFLFGASR